MNLIDSRVPTPKERIYSRIADSGGTVSKAELLAADQLTNSTLTRLLDDLVSEGLIVETGFGPSNGGRKPILYRINPDYRYIIGLEISRFSSTLGLFDMALNPKSLVRWWMDESMRPDALVAHASGMIKSLMRDHGIGAEQILGLGIGAVGPLDRDRGIILRPLYFAAEGWTNVPICSMFEQATGHRAILENGANAALMGEIGAAPEPRAEHALYVHAGVSLRAAMMTNGRIVHGKYDTEGSIGQMIVHSDGPRLHENGNYGALEAFCSVPALERQARTNAKRGGSSLCERYGVVPERINYEILVKALNDGEPSVQQAFHQAAAYLGIGLANLINLYHPELVLLGGALMNSSPDFYRIATETALKNTFYAPDYTPRFSKGSLAEDAVVTGAALNVRKRLEID
ncbi:putative NBD/HSP70 family sugar kinase [Paenibacillus taihuensis]|uniref:Putative NBD/HSP70 family sugar kinase n=1 Tax=Paenibacillus taihuensis TaxID=1156355 RepID=A0A3D9QUZ9_9BACL|nr:ROK family transcriptional regulator [Paenibacillus taihuensis]REE67976.1 putative NBD/HSP70 family sugar kinase [Paenibacillus taihuensis]